VLSVKTCLEGCNLVNLTIHAPWYITGCPSNIFYQTTCKVQAWEGAAKALFCRNIMEACEASEYESESKRKHQVEGSIMHTEEWTRTLGRCTRSRSNKLEWTRENRAKRRREVSLLSNFLFVCSSL
jgi:hypothetical protein